MGIVEIVDGGIFQIPLSKPRGKLVLTLADTRTLMDTRDTGSSFRIYQWIRGRRG